MTACMLAQCALQQVLLSLWLDCVCYCAIRYFDAAGLAPATSAVVLRAPTHPAQSEGLEGEAPAPASNLTLPSPGNANYPDSVLVLTLRSSGGPEATSEPLQSTEVEVGTSPCSTLLNATSLMQLCPLTQLIKESSVVMLLM